MTAVETIDLLTRYGDALEAANPVPRDLSKTSPRDQDALDLLDRRPDDPTRSNLPRILVGAAAIILAVVGWNLLSEGGDVRTADRPDGGGVSLVLPGEIMIRADPLVVLAARPEPDFDTSHLGTRIEIEPVAADAQLDEQVDELIERLTLDLGTGLTSPRIRKMSLLGTLDGSLVSVAVVDWISTGDTGGQPAGSTMRMRSVSQGGGLGGAGDWVSPDEAFVPFRAPATYDNFIASGKDFPEIGSSDFAARTGEGTTEFLVSLDVAALQMVTDSDSKWMVPIDGVTFLPVDRIPAQTIELIAYGFDGVEIARRTMTLSAN